MRVGSLLLSCGGRSDLEWCPAPSDFRQLRLDTVLDKYLSQGAEIPVGRWYVPA